MGKWLKPQKKQTKKKITQAAVSVFFLHSPRVPQSALVLLFELKARHLQDIEEAGAHQIRNGIIRCMKALPKPGESQG